MKNEEVFREEKIQMMEKRVKIQLEFVLRSSPGILYDHISTPTGLTGWFAEKVELDNGKLTFHWDDGNINTGTIQKQVHNRVFRFSFGEMDAEEYVEMEILLDELTQDVSLVVTDFSDESEAESTEMMWGSLVDELRMIIGA